MIALDSMSINVITLFVDDLRAAKSFYQEIFGLSAAYEDESSAVFDFANMSMNLFHVGAVRGPIVPEAVTNQEARSRFQFTILVDDVDAAHADLCACGVTVIDGPMNPCGVRTVCFTDPDGHIWEIAQLLT